MPDEGTISVDEHNAALAETRRKYESKASDAASRALGGLFSELGFESKDALKEALDAARASQEASKTDLEKLQGAYEKATRDLEAARALNESTISAWHGDKIKAAVVAVAGKAHAPEQVFALTRSDYSVDKEGNVVTSSGKSVAEHIDAWLAENPHHMKPQGGSGGGSAPPSPDANRDPDLKTAEGRKARMAELGWG